MPGKHKIFIPSPLTLPLQQQPIPTQTYMNSKVLLNRLCLCLLLLGASLSSAWAQNAIKADTTSMATNTTLNWLSADLPGGTGIQPTTSQIGEFDATPSAGSLANLTLSSENLVMAGYLFDTNMNGAVSIGAGGTLAVGASGLNLSAADHNVVINANYRSGTSQTWNVNSNVSLTLNGTVLLDQSGSAGNQDTNFPTSSATISTITLTGGGVINVPNAVLIPNYTGSGTGI